MKILQDGSKVYTSFEVHMVKIFHELHGSTTEAWEDQSFWPIIQKLKKMAQDEQKEAGQ